MFRKNESGQAIVVMAIGLVVLLAFAALAIDAGNIYTAKREAQNAADAAAMAGTRQIVLECAKQGLNPGPNEANIRNKMLEMTAANNIVASEGTPVQAYYIDENGTRLSESEVGALGAVPCGCGAGTARGVEVVASNSKQSFLAGLLGQEVLGTSATAKARYAPVAEVGSDLYPFTRRDMTIEFNQLVTLRILDDADTLPGSFGWLTWNGDNNIPNLEESLTPPGDSSIKYYNPGEPSGWVADYGDKQVTVGDWTQGAPGNKNSNQVRTLLDWHIAHQTEMIIPLYDAVAGQGSHSNYRVASFAAFQLQSYDFTGQDKSMTGKFVRWVTNGNWAAGVTCAAEDGLYSVKLTP